MRKNVFHNTEHEPVPRINKDVPVMNEQATIKLPGTVSTEYSHQFSSDLRGDLTTASHYSIFRYMSNYTNTEIEQLAELFKALSNPQRLRIFLNTLECISGCGCNDTNSSEVACCVGDLGSGLNISASTISHHIKELRHASFIRVKRRGQFIECRINPETTALVAKFINDVTTQCCPHVGDGSHTTVCLCSTSDDQKVERNE